MGRVDLANLKGPPGPSGKDGKDAVGGADLDLIREAVLVPHIQSPEPHPAYDDLQDFTLLLENGLL